MACAAVAAAAATVALPSAAVGQVPAMPLYVLTTDGQLAMTTLNNPGGLSTPMTLTGLVTGDVLVALDVRPQNQVLYALGVNAVADTVRLYRVAPQSGVLTPLGTPGSLSDGVQTVDLPEGLWTMNFNPAADRVRVMAQTGLNFRMNPNTGAIVDGDAVTGGTNPDGAANGGATTISATAYTNSAPNNGGITTQYTLDAETDALYIQNPPNEGTLTEALPLTLAGQPLDFTAAGGFDIPPSVVAATSNTTVTSGRGYAVLTVSGTPGLYEIDLTTGAATLVGGLTARSVAIQAGTGAAFGLDATRENLVRFDPLTPGTATTVPVAGITAGEVLAGLDVRPATGQLYALGVNAAADTASVYVLDPLTGAATVVGVAGGIAFQDAGGVAVDLPDPLVTDYDIDFNPTVDRLRVVTGTGLNFRVNQTDGTPVDGNLGGTDPVANTNTDGAFNGLATVGSATAYTNSFAGTTVTTQYTLDANSNALYIQNPPNAGTLTAALPVTLEGGATLDFSGPVGFDILADVSVENSNDPAVGVGYFTGTVGGVNQLFRLNLETGVAVSLGTTQTALSALAVQSVSAEAVVNAPTVTAVTADGATLGGTVAVDGGAAVTERGVVYSVTTVNGAPEIGGTGVTRVAAATTGTGSFAVDVSGLQANTGYSFRAYAINAAGTSYSATGTFTPVLDVEVPVLPDVVVSGEYNFDLNTPDGARVTVRGLPPGLKVDPRTGIITGRASAPGSYQVTVTVRTAGGVSTSYITTLNVQALPISAVGSFVAYVAPDSTVNANLGGRLDVKVTTKGSYTLKLVQGNRTATARGFLTATTTATPELNATLRDGTAVNLVLNADATVTGTVTLGQGSAGVTGWRRVNDRLFFPANEVTGYYTVALDAVSVDPLIPQGTGFAAITIGLDGSMKLTGRAADGSALTTTAFIGPEGELLVYAPLYRKQGSISGVLELEADATGNFAENSIDGTLLMTKPVTAGRTYPGAVTLAELTVEGMYMARAASGGLVLGLPSGTEPSSLLFTGAGVDTAVPDPDLLNAVTFPRPTLKPVLPAPGSEANPARTTLTFKPANGAFSGSFTLLDGGVRRVVKYQGMLVRRANGASLGSGFFLLPQLPTEGQTIRNSPILSGEVTLLPNLLTF